MQAGVLVRIKRGDAHQGTGALCKRGECSSGSSAREVLVKICELLGFAPFSLDAQQPLACRASSKRPGRRCSPKRPIVTATLLSPNNSHILTRTPNILARRGRKAAAPLHPSPTRPRHRVHSPVVSLRLPRTCRSSPWGPRTFTGRFLGALARSLVAIFSLPRARRPGILRANRPCPRKSPRRAVSSGALPSFPATKSRAIRSSCPGRRPTRAAQRRARGTGPASAAGGRRTGPPADSDAPRS